MDSVPENIGELEEWREVERVTGTSEDVVQIIRAVVHRMHDVREVLGELDRAIGDGDHGVTMDVGWQAVEEALERLDAPSLEDVFRTAGVSFLRAVGATVGPLYATALLDLAQWIKGRAVLTAADTLPMFEVFVGGLTRRGHAVAGDKTMMDVWIPALAAFREQFVVSGPWNAAVAAEQAAYNGWQSTTMMKAAMGRASRLGDRSIGHADAGARSAYEILATVVQSCQPQG